MDNLHRSRRWFLRDCGIGLGAIASAGIFAEESRANVNVDPLEVKSTHFPAKPIERPCTEAGFAKQLRASVHHDLGRSMIERVGFHRFDNRQLISDL